jgi:hypothetical protein
LVSVADQFKRRLKVRQWTQTLVDHSLVLGSTSKGVHLHDIVLTYLRKSYSPEEMRALQKQVVDGIVEASRQRRAVSGQGLHDTGSTAQAFEGEEVDWYACNVGAYHVKMSMDPSTPLIEQEQVKQWLLLDDEVVFRFVAVSVGEQGLEALCEEFIQSGKNYEAAKMKSGVSCIAGSSHASSAGSACSEALAMLRASGLVTTKAHQLEFDLLAVHIRSTKNGSNERAQAEARIAELAKVRSLRVDPSTLWLGTVFSCLMVRIGMSVKDHQPLSRESIHEAYRLSADGVPLLQRACSESIGARKEVMTMNLLLWSVGPFCTIGSNTKHGAEMYEKAVNERWGADCSTLMHAVEAHDFARHFTIW